MCARLSSHFSATLVQAALAGHLSLLREPRLHVLLNIWSHPFGGTYSIASHTGTPFYVIINPNDGPGSVGSQPDQSYDECIPSLRPSSNPNVVVLGYVVTTSKSSSRIIAEIDTYAGWSSSSRPTGIYLNGAGGSNTGVFKSIVDHAKEKGFNLVALGPMESPNLEYYSLTDLVVTYQGTYPAFKTSDLVISSSVPASKQSVILLKAPAEGSYAPIISQLTSFGVAAVYITDLSTPGGGIPAQWASFVDNVAGIVGAPNDSPSSSPGASPTAVTSNGSAPTKPVTSEISTPSATGRVESHTSALVGTVGGGANDSPSSSSGTAIVTSTGSIPTRVSPPDAAETAEPHTSAPVGAIVGGILGAVILILIAILFILWRRKRTRDHEVALEPFLSRPFTLFQDTVEKPSTQPLRTPSDADKLGAISHDTQLVDTSPSATQYPPSSSSDMKERTHFTTAATVSSEAGTSHRYSVDPPPYYGAAPPR
ncbi:hypothetical protein DXG03_002570 [Asterophora parasitica]|uniref:Uncharacterized protein n=1 Tax=Asterophora parasitica TaxID=117018 RepID=A0A9P7G1V2_9AGAR|nr:hypothetical protein DXG03_002570 [Asterophora parasitica]